MNFHKVNISMNQNLDQERISSVPWKPHFISLSHYSPARVTTNLTSNVTNRFFLLLNFIKADSYNIYLLGVWVLFVRFIHVVHEQSFPKALFYSVVWIYHNLSILLFMDIWVVSDLGLQ